MRRNVKALSGAFIAGIGLLWSVLPLPAYERLQGPTEVLFWNKTNSNAGYTFFGVQSNTYLIDMEGRVVHTWPVGTNPHLLANGDVLDANGGTVNGFTGLKEVDWSGNTVWQYSETRTNYAPHHDFLRIYNAKLGTNTTLYVAAKTVSSNQCIAAGCNPANGPYTNAQVDAIMEVDMAGSVVWEWCFFDHGIQNFDAAKTNYVAGNTISNYPGRLNLNLPGRPVTNDWLHCNSIDYNTNLDQIVINAAGGEFYVIDHGKTFTAGNPAASIALAAGTNGDFIYRFGDPARYGQGSPPSVLTNWTVTTTGNKQIGGSSHAQWIPAGLPGAGHFLVFNNGGDLFEMTPQSYVFEINGYLNASTNDTGAYVNPPAAGYNTLTATNSNSFKQNKSMSRQLVWTYYSQANQGMFSHLDSSVQRLPNGNTLICDSTEGHVFEVTTNGDAVWEYVNPVTSTGIVTYKRDNWPMQNALFRAYRYATNHSAFAGRTLTAGGTITGQSPAYFSAPTISGTAINPATPTPATAVWVTSFVTNAESVASVTLTYVSGNATNTVAMLDDGLHQDGVAGDGIYGGQIPAFSAGVGVSYYVTAKDDFDLTATDPAGAPASAYAYSVQATTTNTAPVFAAMATNYLIVAGNTVLVTNAATDAQSPPQTLVYGLLSSPGGALINTNTGVVSWTTSTNNAGTVGNFSVVVTDNGAPPLSATNNFAVTVVAVLSNTPPVIFGITNSPGLPIALNPVWITAQVTDDVSVASVILTYNTGTNNVTSQTNNSFLETMATNSAKPWTGGGCNYPWTVTPSSGNPFEQAANANYGGGNANGLTFKNGTTNLSDSMITTANGIDGRGVGGTVGFWLQTSIQTSGNAAWTMQLNPGGGFTTRLSGQTTNVQSPSWQFYSYALQPGDLVSNLMMRFQFGENNSANRIFLDQISVATVTLATNAAGSTNVTMSDDGLHNDGAAGDGIYGGQIPAFPTGTTVNYYLTATDGGGLSITNPAGAPGTNYSYTVAVVTNGWSMIKLPDTGQTNRYTTVFGEDRDYLINPPSYADNGNGTVQDNVTGLTWQKVDGGEMTLSNALLYPAATLNATNFAGHNDWRVPTVHELMSILNEDKLNPSIDTNYFVSPGVTITNWPDVYWWSQDVDVLVSSNQWCGNSGGGVGNKPISETISAGGTFNYRIRCVRGAAAPTKPLRHFVDNGNGTVTDTNTGLIWVQGEIGTALDWTNALTYSEGLNYAGYGDWRLPNVKELESLNDETLANPSIDTNYFPNAKPTRYWSSTSQYGDTNMEAWYADFYEGLTSYMVKTTNHWVRCVRGGLTNTPPALAAVSNRTVNAGVTVVITNAASDAETLAGYLTYGLVTAVTNATVNPTNGIFTWRPLVAQAGTTNAFGMVVWDTGAPVLSATQNFQITVNPASAPALAQVTVTNGGLQFNLTGQVGPDYTLQATTNLVNWTNVFTTNAPFSWRETNLTSPRQRFYRVRLGP